MEYNVWDECIYTAVSGSVVVGGAGAAAGGGTQTRSVNTVSVWKLNLKLLDFFWLFVYKYTNSSNKKLILNAF